MSSPSETERLRRVDVAVHMAQLVSMAEATVAAQQNRAEQGRGT